MRRLLALTLAADGVYLALAARQSAMDRPFKPRSLLQGLLAVSLCLMLIAPASASAGYKALLGQACGAKGEVTGSFTQAEYQQALANIPADADQYTDCRAILLAAQLASASGSDASTTSAAGSEAILATATPQQQKAVSGAVTGAVNSDPTAKVGDVVVDPSAFGPAASVSATFNALPLPLIITLALIGVGALAALGAALIPRVRDYYRSR